MDMEDFQKILNQYIRNVPLKKKGLLKKER